MPQSDNTSIDFSDAIEHNRLRERLLQFAVLQLSDQSLAEDMVQEAFIGAIRNTDQFRGKSAFNSWMFAILKNKIVDHLRKKQTQHEISNQDESLALFDNRGHWYQNSEPGHWGDVEKVCASGDFWVVFEACLNHLPERQGKIFMMREYLELNSDEICVTEEITANNLHILLYRARLRLQHCLTLNWYDGEVTDEM